MFSRHSISSVFQQQQPGVFNPFPQQRNASAYNVPQYGSPVKFNPMMAFALAALFTAFFFMGSLCVYVQRCCTARRRNAAAANAAAASLRTVIVQVPAELPPQGLDKETIQSLPLIPFASEDKYSAQAGLKATAECSVCLGEFQKDEVLKFLPSCGHFFHPDCIDMWLFSHSTCPLCRSILVPIKACSSGDENSMGLSQQGPDVSVTIIEDQQGQQEMEEQRAPPESTDRKEIQVAPLSNPSRISSIQRAMRTSFYSLYRSNSSPAESMIEERERETQNDYRDDATQESLNSQALRRTQSTVESESLIVLNTHYSRAVSMISLQMLSPV